MSGIILAQPQELRRDRLASLVLLRRLGTYTVPARRREAGDGRDRRCRHAAPATSGSALAWLALLPALIGTALNLLALLVTHGTPRGRLLRRYEAHLSTIEGIRS